MQNYKFYEIVIYSYLLGGVVKRSRPSMLEEPVLTVNGRTKSGNKLVSKESKRSDQYFKTGVH